MPKKLQGGKIHYFYDVLSPETLQVDLRWAAWVATRASNRESLVQLLNCLLVFNA